MCQLEYDPGLDNAPMSGFIVPCSRERPCSAVRSFILCASSSTTPGSTTRRCPIPLLPAPVSVRVRLCGLPPRRVKGRVRAPPSRTKDDHNRMSSPPNPLLRVHVEGSTTREREESPSAQNLTEDYTHISKRHTPMRSPCGYSFSMPGLTSRSVQIRTLADLIKLRAQ